MQNSEELARYTLDLINQNIKEVNKKKIAALIHLDRMEEKLSFIKSENYSDEEISRAETDWKQAVQSYNDLCDEETANLTDRDLFLKETAE
jgi:hypothetical protein